MLSINAEPMPNGRKPANIIRFIYPFARFGSFIRVTLSSLLAYYKSTWAHIMPFGVMSIKA